MEIETGGRVAFSSGRNFSRPFPSPLDPAALNTPTEQLNHQDLFSRLPRSASLCNLSEQIIDSANVVTNRVRDFTKATSTSIRTTTSVQSLNVNASVSAKTPPRQASGLVATLSRSLNRPVTNITPDLWQNLEKDRKEIYLDVFQPATSADGTTSDPDETSLRKELVGSADYCSRLLTLDELSPLIQFRQLHHLKLTGMLRSYQPMIWATCWLQPFLKTLHLEMSLPPLFNLDTDHPHRPIDSMWCLSNTYGSNPNLSEYLGRHGDGTLHDEFGEGEYLDSQAIKMAQQKFAKELPFNNLRYLPIQRLALMSFAVDGGSIRRWFDPNRLKELEFKEGCIDAGLYLCQNMRDVKIISPKAKPLHQFARVIKPGGLKLVELKKGQLISLKDAVIGREELPNGQKQQPGLKAKVSQLMHGLGGKNKENKAVDRRDETVKEIENVFSAAEIRAAKDGKKPVRD